MANGITIEVKGVDEVVKKLGDLLSPSQLTRLNREIGINVRERTADHIGRASVSRHKTADRLGAMHTGFLEFAPARGELRGGSNYKGTGDKPYTEVQNISQGGVSVVIANTPSLVRAFGPVTITPKRAKALTIPISKEAYGRSARDFPRKLACITTRKGHALLVEKNSESDSSMRAHYRLVSKTTLPQDSGLLPVSTDIEEWAEDTIEVVLESCL